MGEICPTHEITKEYVETMLDKGALTVEEIVGSGCPICTSRVRKMIDDYNRTSIFERSSGDITRLIR